MHDGRMDVRVDGRGTSQLAMQELEAARGRDGCAKCQGQLGRQAAFSLPLGVLLKELRHGESPLS
jgi:hypothetical protein